MTCNDFQTLLDSENHLVDEEIDALILHLNQCYSCGEKYPPMTELEFEAYVANIEYQEEV